jgi:hypothetical protein
MHRSGNGGGSAKDRNTDVTYYTLVPKMNLQRQPACFCMVSLTANVVAMRRGSRVLGLAEDG